MRSHRHFSRGGSALGLLRRLVQPFRRLQWKLTFGYTLFAVVFILLLQAAGLAALRTMRGMHPDGRELVRRLRRAGESLHVLLREEPPDGKALADLMRGEFMMKEDRPQGRFRGPRAGQSAVAGVTDREGGLIACFPNETAAAGLMEREEYGEILRAALKGETRPDLLQRRLPDGGLLAAAPVFDERQVPLGALFVALPKPPGIQGALFAILSWRNVGPITLVAALVGAAFGFVTASWLTRRLRSLETATAAWGRGNFSVSVRDRGGDELSRLTRRLNIMAIQVRDLLSARERLAVLEERNRLARDLHDAVNQEIYGMTLYAKAAQQNLALGDVGKAGEHLRDLLSAAEQAMREMRLLVFELRPPALEKEGLAAALKARLEAVEERSGIQTQLLVEGDGELPPEFEAELYRLAQEALNNALRHANARRIAVRLRFAGGRAHLEITDDGAGFDVSSAVERGGLGLRGMRERIALLGGTLALESAPGRGTRVKAEVPC